MSYLEDLFSIEGRIALLTGAARGLGRSMTDALANADAHVIMVGSNEQRLRDYARELKDAGHSVHPIACDLGDTEQIIRLVETVTDRHDRLDILVNNAGVTLTHELSGYPDEYWRKTFDINVDAPFQLVRRFVALLKASDHASVINITSIGAEQGFPNNPAYAAAKGALKQLTRALAADLGGFGVRVNNIAPGYFPTDMTQLTWGNPETRRARTDGTLLGRWGDPQDLAGALIYLASDASAFMTGQTLTVDGGWVAKAL